MATRTTCRPLWALCVSVVAVACVAADEYVPSDAEFEPFLSWFNSMGGKAPSVGLKRFASMGTGVLAEHEVAPGDTVLSVPMELVVCRSTLDKSDDPVAVAARTIKEDDDMVAAWLMAHKHLGTSSRFHPYIAALPSHVPLPNTFTNKELDLLEDKRHAMTAKKRKRRDRRRLKNVVAPAVTKALDGATPEAIASATSLDSYLWALNLVGSRALTIRGRKYLVPFADMFNYEPHGDTRDADSGANFLKYHKLGEKTFDIVADRAASAGEQLFEDYGDNGNELYLNHHGFVAANNPFDCVRLQLPPILPRQGKLGQDKRALLKAMRVDARSIDTCSRASRPISYPVHVYLAVAAMDELSIEECRDIINGARDRTLLEPCFGQAFAAQDIYHDEVLTQLLAATARDQLQAYSTTAEEDEALLAASDLNSHQHLAVSFRLTRKRLLLDLVARCEGVLSGGVEAVEVSGAGDVQATPTTTPQPEYHHVTHRVRTDDEMKVIVQRFNDWVAAANPPVNAIEARWVGQGMRVGVHTTADVKDGEVYLSAPVSIIMSRDSARKSPHLRELFKRLDAKYPRGDAFHELLLHLMYEAFVLGAASQFAPYIDIIPNTAEIGGPIHWPAEDLDFVRGSQSHTTILEYNATVDRRFALVKKAVFDANSDILPPSAFTLANYRWAYGILDSRSIWWNGARHLVPLLDLINCAEGPDPSRVHSTVLDDSGTNAITRAAWDFPQGAQLFENYGQPNHIYFEYHGFALVPNSHDCVQVGGFSVPADLPDRDGVLSRLQRFGIRGDPGAASVLCVGTNEFSDGVRAFTSLVYGATSRSQALRALRPLIQKQLDGYSTSVDEDVSLLADDGRTVGGVGSHRWNAVQYRLAEKRILASLLAEAA